MIIRKSLIVFCTCLCFIIGVGFASFFIFPWLILYIGIIIGLVIIVLTKKRTLVRTIGWCFLFLIFGIARYQLSIPVINESHIAYYNNAAEAKYTERQSVVFQGIINDEPDIRKDHVKYKLKSLRLEGLRPRAQNLKLKSLTQDSKVFTDNWQNVHGNILVKAPLYPQYQYGDLLEIECALTQPDVIEDFRYDKYLAKADIYSTCYQPKIKLIESGKGSFFQSAILKLKARVVETVGQILPEPQASFLGGLLWGAKKGMPEEILENFNRTGVTHIIAVSGYNITIIATMLNNLFISLGISRKKAFWLIVLAVSFFIVITGFPSSIIRAGIMGLVVLIAQTVGRAPKMTNTLAIVCLIMLLFNPKILIWDTGFQLSFLATVGLVYLSSTVKKIFARLPDLLSIKESLSTTLSAIIMTAPLILFQFGRFSIIAPIANLLILPIIPINMAVGFLAVVLGLIWLPLGQAAGWISWVFLTYVLELTEIFSTIDWASREVTNLPWIFMVGGYLIIGWFIYKHKYDSRLTI